MKSKRKRMGAVYKKEYSTKGLPTKEDRENKVYPFRVSTTENLKNFAGN